MSAKILNNSKKMFTIIPIKEPRYIEQFFTLLNSGVDVNYVDKTTRKSLLFIACENLQEEYVDALLNKGADPNFIYKEHLSYKERAFSNLITVALCEEFFLIESYNKKIISIIKKLIEKGADIHWEDGDGWFSPNYITNPNIELISSLINLGFDFNKTNKNNIRCIDLFNDSNPAKPLIKSLMLEKSLNENNIDKDASRLKIGRSL